jgi:Low-density lipoprotein receptor domain class A
MGRAHSVVLIGFAAFGCGGDSSGGNADLCQKVKDKIAECHLNINTSGQCQSDPGEKVLCTSRCFANATCAEMALPATSNGYYRCIVACNGGGADDFICADGTASVKKQGVCDGTAQCPDGSDEASCSK